jgi:hypothetical protein
MATLGGGLLAFSALSLCAVPQQAQAQAPTQAEHLLGALLSTGGYWFTSASATRALGTPKFYGQQAFYGHSASLANYRVSGGFEFVQASDHFFPFSGGNSFGLYGFGGRISTPSISKFRPYLTAGLYYGTVHSDMLGFTKSAFVPSIALGAEWKFNRFVTLAVDYRLSADIGGVNTDGFSISIRIF